MNFCRIKMIGWIWLDDKIKMIWFQPCAWERPVICHLITVCKYNDDLCKMVFNFFGHDWEAPFWVYECILCLWKTQTKYEVFLLLLCDGRHDSAHESATAEICFYKTSCQSFPLDAIELMHSKWWCHKAALFNLYIIYRRWND